MAHALLPRAMLSCGCTKQHKHTYTAFSQLQNLMLTKLHCRVMKYGENIVFAMFEEKNPTFVLKLEPAETSDFYENGLVIPKQSCIPT